MPEDVTVVDLAKEAGISDKQANVIEEGKLISFDELVKSMVESDLKFITNNKNNTKFNE